MKTVSTFLLIALLSLVCLGSISYSDAIAEPGSVEASSTVTPQPKFRHDQQKFGRENYDTGDDMKRSPLSINVGTPMNTLKSPKVRGTILAETRASSISSPSSYSRHFMSRDFGGAWRTTTFLPSDSQAVLMMTVTVSSQVRSKWLYRKDDTYGWEYYGEATSNITGTYDVFHYLPIAANPDLPFYPRGWAIEVYLDGDHVFNEYFEITDNGGLIGVDKTTYQIGVDRKVYFLLLLKWPAYFNNDTGHVHGYLVKWYRPDATLDWITQGGWSDYKDTDPTSDYWSSVSLEQQMFLYYWMYIQTGRWKIEVYIDQYYDSGWEWYHVATLLFTINPPGPRPIYIRPNGSVDPPTANISTVNNITYTFTDDINNSIVVERSNIIVDGNGYTLNGTRTGKYAGFAVDYTANNLLQIYRSRLFVVDIVYNVTIQNVNIRGFKVGVKLVASSNNSILGNNITENNGYSIRLYDSSNNTISGNNITNNWHGIGLVESPYNTLRNNDASNNKYNFGVYGWSLSYYIQDIDDSNTVNGKPVYYWVNRRDMTVPLDAGFVALINCTRITVKNLNLTNNGEGVFLALTTNSTVTKNSITNNWGGIVLEGSSNYNTVSGNNITNNSDGIWLYESSNNIIYHNNFVNNTEQAYSYDSTNVWDDGYPSGGNYWSDYTGVDEYSGPAQNETGSDGIIDAPYVVDSNNRDRYPVMKPNGWIQNTTIAFSLTPNPAYLGQTVTLQGSLQDEYNRPLNDTEVSVYLNGTHVAQLQTNSTGWFKATGAPSSIGTYEIKVSFNGTETRRPSSYTQALTILPKIDTEISFNLSPNPAQLGEPITLTGNLTDQHDNPIDNAAVDVYYSTDNATWHFVQTLYTNSGGRFNVTGVPYSTGTYHVAVLYKGSYKHNPSYHIETLTVEE